LFCAAIVVAGDFGFYLLGVLNSKPMKFLKKLRFRMKRCLFLLAIVSLPCLSAITWAVDIVRIPQTQSEMDVRYNYKNAILLRALELTEAEFGAYELSRVGCNTGRQVD
jgi:hypothetical protein